MFEPIFYDDYVKAIKTKQILGYTGDCYTFFTFLTRHYSNQYIETVARHILNSGCMKCFFYDDVCLTSTVDNEDEFRDELDLSICIVKKPSDIVILYDDEAVYNSMKTRLFQEERDACDNWYERTSKL